MLTMAPPLMCVAHARDTRNVPRALISSTRSHASTVISKIGVGGKMPAPLTTMSICPIAAIAWSANERHCASSRTSTATAIAGPPAARTRSAVSLAASTRTSAATIDAPACARRSAHARPIPEPAPVMTATRPRRLTRSSMGMIVSVIALLPELVQALRVARKHQVTLISGHAGHRCLDGAPRVGPVGADVGVVARPQDVLDADLVTVLQTEGVGHVREVHVLLDVLARQPRQGVAIRRCQPAIVVVDLFL